MTHAIRAATRTLTLAALAVALLAAFLAPPPPPRRRRSSRPSLMFETCRLELALTSFHTFTSMFKITPPFRCGTCRSG